MDRPLRILHVSPYFPPVRIGGVGEVVAQVHRELLRRGHSSEVLTTGGGAEDVLIHRVAETAAAFVLLSGGHVPLARRADVVHMHHGEALGLLVASKALRVGVPVLLTLHASAAGLRRSMDPFWIDGHRVPAESSWTHREVTMRVRHILDRVAMQLADETTFISRSTARDFLPAGQAGRATIVYNGLPRTAAASGPIPKPVDLLYVGVYRTWKRVQMLPLVLSAIRRRRPESRLRIVGFHLEDHPDFLALAERAGVADAIVSEGALRSEEVAPYYRASRVLLVPSAYEGLPMVILEAFREGLPCVGTRVSGLPEVIEDGRNGRLVDPDDPAAMARAALTILDCPETAHRMSEAARATIEERFNVERQVDEYLELYGSLVTDSSGSP